jgi:hypothetical protein
MRRHAIMDTVVVDAGPDCEQGVPLYMGAGL